MTETEGNRPINQQISTLRYLPGHGGTVWVERYLAEVLAGKEARTQDAYARILLLTKQLHIEAGKPIPIGTFVALVLIPQYVLFLGIPLAAAYYLRAKWTTTFQWRLPRPMAFVGAGLVGISSWLVVIQLATWLSRVWPMDAAGCSMAWAEILRFFTISSTAGQARWMRSISRSPAATDGAAGGWVA